MKKADKLQKYKDTTFEYYDTPRHGYLLVPNELIVLLGIKDDISFCSYELFINRKKWAYLEEDCDASHFLITYKEYFGYDADYTWIESTEEKYKEIKWQRQYGVNYLKMWKNLKHSV